MILTLKYLYRKKETFTQKFQEEHIQRGYRLDEIKQLLEESGLTFLEAYEEYTMQAPQPDSGRIVVVAQEHGKKTGGIRMSDYIIRGMAADKQVRFFCCEYKGISRESKTDS